jgi:hypothetical protein
MSTLGQKMVAQNSTLIHPGPQVNLSGIHRFSYQFSTLSKPYSIRHDENLARYSTPFIFLNDRNSTCWKNAIAQNSTATRRLGGDRVFTGRCTMRTAASGRGCVTSLLLSLYIVHRRRQEVWKALILDTLSNVSWDKVRLTDHRVMRNTPGRPGWT